MSHHGFCKILNYAQLKSFEPKTIHATERPPFFPPERKRRKKKKNYIHRENTYDTVFDTISSCLCFLSPSSMISGRNDGEVKMPWKAQRQKI